MIEEELPDELENDLDDIEPVGDESQLYEHFRVVVDKGQAMVRVDKYLFERIVNASRNRIQKAAEDGFVMANGKPVKSSYKVKPLDVITVMMDRPRYENEIIPENIPLISFTKSICNGSEQACGTGSTSGTRKLSRYACQCVGMAHERYS